MNAHVKGFTLIEVLIVAAIAATVAIVVVFSIQPAMRTESTEKLYEQTAGLLVAIHASGELPQSDTDLVQTYPTLSQGFSIQRTGDRNQFVYLKHATPDGFTGNRIAGLTNVSDGAFMVYLGTVGLTAGVPSGTIVPFAGDVVPDGWLLCDGRTLDRASYPGLSAVLKSIYGGNVSQFNLPSFSGKFLRGGTPGGTGGANAVTLSVSNMPSHSHGGGGNTAIRSSNPGEGSGEFLIRWQQFVLKGMWGTKIDFSSVGGAASVGGGSPVSILPTYADVSYIIKI